MSKKTFFKRIALVVVSALGSSLLAVQPSFAVNASGDATLTLSASSATIASGETASVTVTTTFTSDLGFGGIAAADSAVIYVSGPATGGTLIIRPVSDTANAQTAKVAGVPIVTGIGTNWNGTTGPVSNGVNGGAESSIAISGTFAHRGDSINATQGGTYTKATYSYFFTGTQTAGTYIFTFSLRDKANTYLAKSATFTLTVTAAATGANADQSKMWVHGSQYAAGTNGISGAGPRSDSAVVKSAGDAGFPVAVAWIVPEFANASGETANSTTGTLFNDSLLVTVSGPGLLHLLGKGVANSAPSDSVLAKAKYVSQGETLVVFSDGTAGTATLTGSIGGKVLAQAAKTINFWGKPATITITSDSPQVSSSGYSSTDKTSYGPISFVVKDSAGNAITTSGNKNTGTPGGFYALVSDTKVVGGTAYVNTASNAYTACSYNTTRGRWFCDLPITDSGTVTITIADSYLASNAPVSATASLQVVGAAYKGTMALDKTSYDQGAKMILTLTAVDYGGRNVVNGAANPFGQMSWNTNPVFTQSTGSDAAGGTFTDLATYVAGSTTYVNGVDTAVVYAPSRAGTYTLTTTTNGKELTPVTLTFTVNESAADKAQNAAIAAAQAAADAATDAALQAIDAANAATDAANLAAEAADAATVAAQESKDSADAATAAVESLATQVATLMAALQAQITSLANVVAKIARKVKA